MKKVYASDDDMLAAAAAQSGTLYLVPTPIGNLGDITARALDILRSVDMIAAEDTRHSAKLLRHFDIRTPTTPCHDHNEEQAASSLVKKLTEGKSIALISDAGTPLLSDPGYRLIQMAIDANVSVIALPGANALLPALQLSGLPAHPFYFYGFLPSRSKARTTVLGTLAALDATLVFYEAPHRLAEMLGDAAEILGGNRSAAVVREISKKFEEVRRGTLQELGQHYRQNDAKGEIVVTIGGSGGEQKWDEETVADALAKALRGGAALREAVAIIAAQSHWPKRDVYDMALQHKQNEGQ